MSLTFITVENRVYFQLLHSLDEDDRSVSAHTTNLNALSPRASKSTSPTANITMVNDQLAFVSFLSIFSFDNKSGFFFFVIGTHIKWSDVIDWTAWFIVGCFVYTRESIDSIPHSWKRVTWNRCTFSTAKLNYLHLLLELLNRILFKIL